MHRWVVAVVVVAVGVAVVTTGICKVESVCTEVPWRLMFVVSGRAATGLWFGCGQDM